MDEIENHERLIDVHLEKPPAPPKPRPTSLAMTWTAFDGERLGLCRVHFTRHDRESRARSRIISSRTGAAVRTTSAGCHYRSCRETRPTVAQRSRKLDEGVGEPCTVNLFRALMNGSPVSRAISAAGRPRQSRAQN